MSIAIFDLDGTITRHDTLFPLVLRWLARRPWQLARLLLVVPAALRFLFDRDRAALKQSLLRATMRARRAPRWPNSHAGSCAIRSLPAASTTPCPPCDATAMPATTWC